MNALNNFITYPKDSLGEWTVHQQNTDGTIWSAFKAGDKTAFETMFRKHYQFLINYGLKFAHNEDDVKDHIQILFSRLWESRERLGSTDSIKSYLLASLRRMILRGSKSKYQFTTISDHVGSPNLHVSNNYLAKTQESERNTCLTMFIERLPRRQKEAIYLKFYGENQFHEVAEIMGISTRVVYKLIYKAVKNLSKEIGERRGCLEILMD